MIKRKSVQEPSKKRLERLYLEHFRGLVHWEFPVEERESPDFLLHTPDGLLGVEVTRLFKDSGPRGSLAKKREERRAAFLRGLAAEYYAKGGRPLYLNLLLDGIPGARIPGDVVDSLRHQRPNRPWATHDFRMRLHDRDATVFMTALPDECREYARWQCVSDSVGWVRRVDTATLEECIRKKSTRLNEYRKVASCVLLLVVADHLRDSGMLSPQEVRQPMSNFGFSSVYFLSYPSGLYRLA